MSDIKIKLETALTGNQNPVAGALPVERLAHALGQLPKIPKTLPEVLALLSDPLTGGLLYRTHPELMLSRLEESTAPMNATSRIEVLHALLALAPIRSEDVVRYVALGLELLQIEDGAHDQVRARWTTDEKITIYRWSSVMLFLPALQVSDIVRLFQARGISNEHSNAWEIFQAWFGFRATVMLTPAMSPAAKIKLEELHRPDWLTMPWMLGTPKTTFMIDEVDDDASPENMQDGSSVTHVLTTQRIPWTDFFSQSHAWHPRQTLATAVRIAAEKGTTLVEPAAYDRTPLVVEAEKLNPSARQIQAEGIRALANAKGALPADLALVFVYGNGGAQYGVFEFSLSTHFGNDAQKYSVQVYLGNAESLVQTFEKHSAALGAATLPTLLAALFSHSPRIFVRAPKGPAFEVSAQAVATWNQSGLPTRPALHAVALPSSREVVGSWRGHTTSDLYEDPQPFLLEIEVGESVGALATLADGNKIELLGSARENRLALRQAQVGMAFVLEGVWNDESATLEGRWRNGHMGGKFTLQRESAMHVPSASELLSELTSRWSARVSRVALESVRYPGELETLRSLFEDEHFRSAYVESAANRALGTTGKQMSNLLGRGASELSRAMLPSAFRALDKAVAAFGLEEKVRLWVHNDSSLNAFVSVEDNIITVHFSAGALDTLSENELTAVIGHELAHVVLGHQELVLRMQNARMSGATQSRYFTLRRYQELGCDRMALIACGEANVVITSQTVMRTGIRKRELFGNAQALIANAWAEVELFQGRRDPQAKRDTHPYDSLRIAALDTFSKNNGAHDALSLELAKLLETPGQTADDSSSPVDVSRFHALAAMQLVEADRSIAAKEVGSLMSLRGPVVHELQQIWQWSYERRLVEIAKLAPRVIEQLATPEREQLLVDLIGIVRSDNVVQYAETGVVQELSWLLNVDTHSFQKTITELYKSAR